MRHVRELTLIAAATVAGFLGGVAAVHLPSVAPARAAENSTQQELSGPGIVSAQRFVLLSPDKKVRGVIATDKKGMPSLEFFDSQGVRRVMLADGSGGSSLMLYGPSGTNHAGLAVASNGEPQFYMLNRDAKVSAILASQPDGGTLLALYPGGGKPRAVMAVLANGAPVLNLTDQKGSAAFKAP